MWIAIVMVVIGLVGAIDAIIQTNSFKNTYNRNEDDENDDIEQPLD